MPLTDENREHFSAQIDALNIGEEVSLRDLYGDGWDTVENKTGLGNDFMLAVTANEFPQLEYVRIARAGRHNLYSKIPIDALG